MNADLTAKLIKFLDAVDDFAYQSELPGHKELRNAAEELRAEITKEQEANK
ncbi:MAG: hypothetical protein ACOYYS_19205 [Chloroflexota bacterium]